jgi:hypothetical protein
MERVPVAAVSLPPHLQMSNFLTVATQDLSYVFDRNKGDGAMRTTEVAGDVIMERKSCRIGNG